MSKRGRRQPPGDYEVGYCKPPRHTQFGPGNPGRTKGTRNKSKQLSLKQIVRNISARKIRIKRGEGLEQVSMSEVIEHRLVQMVTQGSVRETAFVLGLLERYPASETAEDQNRLEVYLHHAAGSDVPLPSADLFEKSEK